MRGLGYKPDPPDARDRSVEHLRVSTAALPASASLRSWVCEVLDQGETQSCVAQATAQSLRIAMGVAGAVSPPLPSRRQLYWSARARSGDLGADSGTTIRAAFGALGAVGIASEDACPWDGTLLLDEPAWDVWQRGYDSRMSGYYRIGSIGSARGEAVRAALTARHPVVLGLRIDDSFESQDGRSPWPGPRGEVLGGHAVCLVGYDAERVVLCNSWGTSWADSGLGAITWEALGDPTIASDLWVPTVTKEAT